MIKVMIIEDDPMVRDINTKFLQKVEGFQLTKAVSNLTQAQRFIEKQKPDLILLDIYLPKENGIDFLKLLRAKEIEVDVILITADKTINRVQEAFRYGARDYLIKPFTLERFKESLLKFKDRYYHFKKANEIEQSELDKYILSSKDLVEEENNRNLDLTKGLNKYTYKTIWQQVQQIGEIYTTPEELGEILGIARVTCRKYLDYMNKEGKVHMLIEYGKVGRPQHKYRINPTA
ncbi:response regulator [Clostridium sp. CM028]|uniref:response regulator n=1 Tax=unclassified Clostridium TaxID=2614128 RepID=UPI001C0CF684|nr:MULTISPECIES: response regulator [unclassified Clostridium]MBU3090522.1 response regulator [Clostridium sp. CF011]MBW9145920.1 response regulator [Clostridium sp. CM027]MBW9149609.1 response regulator [Clostridium sp. CM028]UVE40897.1 response regulator [Clostridium sp. CM027]WAG69883.1 response regulator [Clostridium sp. CF011]